MEGDDEDPDQNYAWEGMVERPWEAVSQAADGTLLGASAGRRRGQVRPVQVGVKRGMLRSLFLVLDASKQASENDADMRPNRLSVEVDVAIAFVRDFFEQNPISTLAVLVMRDMKAELLTELSCNPRQHLEALARLVEQGGRGEASLQNALELARESLHAVPSFTSREVVLLSASLSTCDPGDIHMTIAALRRDKLRTSVFSLLAEIYIHRRIAEVTAGEAGVVTASLRGRSAQAALRLGGLNEVAAFQILDAMTRPSTEEVITFVQEWKGTDAAALAVDRFGGQACGEFRTDWDEMMATAEMQRILAVQGRYQGAWSEVFSERCSAEISMLPTLEDMASELGLLGTP